MAAITIRLLRLRPLPRPHTTTLHHFSSDHPTPQPEPESEPEPKSPFSSYFNDVKSSLHNQPPSTPTNRPRTQFPQPPPPPPTQSASLQEIYRNLSEYRNRTAPPLPPPSTGQYVSFQELLKKNAPNTKPVDSTFLSRFKENLNPPTVGGGVGFPSLGFKKGNEGGGSGSGFAYKHPELGKKLRVLRPEKRKGDWFSLQELSDRLVRLREIEEKESRVKSGGASDHLQDLRNSLKALKSSEDEKKKVKTVQKLDVLSNLGGTPSYMLYPPKEDLLEQYFHPDNMSSAEKMKLELKKVRDEFKMSESDCGSARVQVAQLTTKIKHLSTVLAKKDKHSRKGLQAMVQKRKKLLKYLRRTDWDSYSLVLSKLGLRDNPDIKA